MSALSWRSATHEDLVALRDFTCTEKPGKPSAATAWEPPHPRRWELEVQRAVRGIPKLPSDVSPFRLVVGVGDDEIVAVSYYKYDGPERVELWLGAVALPYQTQGHGLALMNEVLDRITEAAVTAGVAEVRIFGMIHKDNAASKAMCSRVGLTPTGFLGPRDGEEWGMRLLVGGAEGADPGTSSAPPRP